jgi:integrase
VSHLFLDEAQIHRLLELAKDNPRDYALFQLAACTALRGSDLLRLKRADVVDRNGEVVRLLRLKMKKTERYIERPLRDDCRTALARLIEGRKDSNPYLFASANPLYTKHLQPLHRASYHKLMKFYLAKLYPVSILKGSSTHTLRRSVAKLVYNKSGRLETATLLLGHTSPVSTMIYIDADEIRETANGIVDSLDY